MRVLPGKVGNRPVLLRRFGLAERATTALGELCVPKILARFDQALGINPDRLDVFANVILADEINRATPRTQSALLEAMQEEVVTVFGIPYSLEPPFMVLATQNPIEMEGTYPLPEAQIDRFIALERAGRIEVTGMLANITPLYDLDQLVAPVVGLAHDALPGLGDVVLEAYHVFKTQRPAHLGRDLHGLVVGRVAPVETDEG